MTSFSMRIIQADLGALLEREEVIIFQNALLTVVLFILYSLYILYVI